MPHEPSGSCPPVQQAPAKSCAACGQARLQAEFPTSLAGRATSCCQGCRRATARLAGRRRSAAMRLLMALHPEEWAGLLALVGGRRQAASHAPAGVARMAERSARRPRRVAVVDAPSARAASLASSAACRWAPGAGRSRAADPPGNPPVIVPGIPPATDGGPHLSPLSGVAAGQVPFGGVERTRRKERFARLIDRRVRALGQAFGLRRLRRQIDADRIVTLGGGPA
jgi:hypothetical protein